MVCSATMYHLWSGGFTGTRTSPSTKAHDFPFLEVALAVFVVRRDPK